MRKLAAFLVLLAIVGGGGYYAYSRNWGPSNWIRQKLGYSDDAKTTANVKSAFALSQRVAPFKGLPLPACPARHHEGGVARGDLIPG